MREDPNEVYDRRRCRCCGRPWDAWFDHATGEGECAHPYDTICNRHRPDIAPPWVAEALARHEVARGAACATTSNLRVLGGEDAANGKLTTEEARHA